jgi:hypothetical protein
MITLIITTTVPTGEEGHDKDCVTYEQFAESIKKNMALTNETDSLQVAAIIPFNYSYILIT